MVRNRGFVVTMAVGSTNQPRDRSQPPPVMISASSADLAYSMYSEMFSKDASSITAAMKFVKSSGSPILIRATSAVNRSLKAGHRERGTYIREAAEHFWPWYSKAPRTAAATRASTSAEAWTKMKSLPPVSPTIRG